MTVPRGGLWVLSNALLLPLAGCHLLLGINQEPAATPDAGPDAPSLACTAVTEHDEDSDQIADICDPCPGIKSAATVTHSDPDMLPDACDPHPLLDGDRQQEFISFAESDAGTRWISETDAWGLDLEPNVLRFNDPSFANGYKVITDTALAPSGAFTMAARIVIEETPASRGLIGIASITSGTSVLRCVVERTSGGASILALGYGTLAGQFDTRPLPPIENSSSYLLELTYDPKMNLATCRARTETAPGSPEGVTTTTVMSPPLGRAMGFEAVGLLGRVEHATIFGRGPATAP